MTYTPPCLHGPTSDRPLSPEIGTKYFDTDYGATFYWSGEEGWVDAAGAGGQIITVQFGAPTYTLDPNNVPSKADAKILVTTSDNQPTQRRCVVYVANPGTGTAVVPDDYTTDPPNTPPYLVEIPLNTNDGSEFDANLLNALVRPNPAIPPSKTIDLAIDSVIAATIGVQDTTIVTLDT